ncbi:hypothetical protein [Dactylosporangium sp. NPDC048998]
MDTLRRLAGRLFAALVSLGYDASPIPLPPREDHLDPQGGTKSY